MRTLFDIDEAAAEGPARPKRRPAMCEAEKEFHVALWSLVKGKGPVLKNLAIVASYGHNRPFTEDAVKAIVKRVEYDYAPEDVAPSGVLDDETRRYLERRYGSETDPSVRDWLRQNVSGTRSRPDWRRSSDRVPKLGKPRRVRAGAR